MGTKQNRWIGSLLESINKDFTDSIFWAPALIAYIFWVFLTDVGNVPVSLGGLCLCGREISHWWTTCQRRPLHAVLPSSQCCCTVACAHIIHAPSKQCSAIIHQKGSRFGSFPFAIISNRKGNILLSYFTGTTMKQLEWQLELYILKKIAVQNRCAERSVSYSFKRWRCKCRVKCRFNWEC